MTPKAKFLSLCIVPVLLFIVLARVADMRAKEAENHLVIVNASGQVVKQLSVMFLSFPFNAGPQKIVLSPGHNLFNFTNIPKGSQVDIQYEWLPMHSPTYCQVKSQFADGRKMDKATVLDYGTRRIRPRKGQHGVVIICPNQILMPHRGPFRPPWEM